MAGFTVYAAADHRAATPMTTHLMMDCAFFVLEPPVASSVLVLYSTASARNALVAAVWKPCEGMLSAVGSLGVSRAITLEVGTLPDGPDGVVMVALAEAMPKLQAHLVGAPHRLLRVSLVQGECC